MTGVNWETKSSCQSESAGDPSKSAGDPSKQFYHGTKNNEVDYMHESNGRSKNKIILRNYPGQSREFGSLRSLRRNIIVVILILMLF